MSIFHAYDIRGIFQEDFDEKTAYRIGFYLPAVLNSNNILVGRDCRLSSPVIFSRLCEGINDAGADVSDAGLTTTPMIYWATAKFGFSASVMITASHNPKTYNGFKVSSENALPVGYDNGLNRLEKLVFNNSEIESVPKKGETRQFEFIDEYLTFQKKYLDFDNQLKIAVDCSNGMSGLFARKLYGESNIVYLNEQPDGNFPGHDPNPLNPENVKQLQNAVVENNCDLGIIFDGDADRVMFVDENGRFVPPDLIIGLMAPYFLKKSDSAENVLQDIRTSRSVTEYIERLGGAMHMWRVGRAYAALKLREIDGIYGGELAGHYYFRDFYYSDSAFMAASIVLNLLNSAKKSGKQFSQKISEIKVYANSGEINFRIEQKKEAMTVVRDYFLKNDSPTAYFDFDGFRVEFSTWWFNIRPSNTEPYLRLLVEASNPEKLRDKLNIIRSILKKYE
ncbi:MAG: phosphomannomutase/phosphoglucomutase [Bacteroidales bacterium]|nr:phosphomannomutase/phosphoglucomutase [Bacteroidales bacterium]